MRLHPDLVEDWVQEAVKENELREAGYKSIAQAARDIGIPEKTLKGRSVKLRGNAEKMAELASALDIEQDEIFPKGASEASEVFVHPVLVLAWENAQKELASKLDEGYVPLSEAEKIAGFSLSPFVRSHSEAIWKSSDPTTDQTRLVSRAALDVWLESRAAGSPEGRCPNIRKPASYSERAAKKGDDELKR